MALTESFGIKTGVRSALLRQLARRTAIPVWSALLALSLVGCGGGGGGGSSAAPPTSTYSISGMVTYNGQGVDGVTVDLSTTGGKLATKAVDSSVIDSKVTAGGGIYTFTGVPAGSYAVSSADTKYGFAAVPVSVTGAAVTAPVAAAYPVFTITGKTTLDGSPLAGATVTLYKTTYTIYAINGFYSTRDPNNGGSESVLLNPIGTVSQTTGADGSYTFTAVRSGSYTVKPSFSGYVFQLASIKTLDNSGVVTITDDGTVYRYNPEGNGNQLAVNNTIIYNSAPSSLTNSTLSGIDFLASVPGGTTK